MTVAYDAIDLGSQFANTQTSFANQLICMIKHSRESIPGTVKYTVTYVFKDGVLGYSYKHYVPYGDIFDQIIGMTEGKLTRTEAVATLTTLVGQVNASYVFGETNPLGSRAAFDAWLDEAIVALCDWAPNIFQAASEGDGNGTKLDQPSLPYGAGLPGRLSDAYNQYKTLGLTSL